MKMDRSWNHQQDSSRNLRTELEQYQVRKHPLPARCIIPSSEIHHIGLQSPFEVDARDQDEQRKGIFPGGQCLRVHEVALS